LFLDGRELARADVDGFGLSFSNDGEHMAYVLENRKPGTIAVVDGKEGPPYLNTCAGFPIFSADGRHVAYPAQKADGRWVDVEDGREGPVFDEICQGPIFSPDGNRLVYVAGKGNFRIISHDIGASRPQQCIVLDGKPGPWETAIYSPTFSPDSRHLAYIELGGEWHFVLDGKEGPAYPKIAVPWNSFNLVFSPDSRHTAYVAWKGKICCVVVDGKEQAEYDGADMQAFSPDSKHLAYYARKGPKWVLVTDGIEGPEYDDIIRNMPYGRPPAFRPDGAVEYLAVRGNFLYRVTQPLPAPVVISSN
jgi:hypothetical protein